MTPELAEFLATLKTANVSLDGPRDYHDRFGGGEGSFDQAVSAAELLSAVPVSWMERDLPTWGAELCDPDFSHWDGQHSVMRLPFVSRRRLVELYLEAIAMGYERGLDRDAGAATGGR